MHQVIKHLLEKKKSHICLDLIGQKLNVLDNRINQIRTKKLFCKKNLHVQLETVNQAPLSFSAYTDLWWNCAAHT